MLVPIQFNINRLVVRESSKYLVLLHEYFHAFIIRLFISSVYVTMAEKCLICASEVESDLCNVGKKGIIGLVKASVLRKDGKEAGFRNKTNGVVHNSCRREYVRSDSIKRFLRDTLSDQPSTSRDVSSLRHHLGDTWKE